MNNIIKIYANINGSGSNAVVETGFRIYKGSYKAIDIELYIPKTMISTDPNISTTVSVGGLLVSEDGKNITTKNYFCTKKRDETSGGVQYAVYGRAMPHRFTAYEGTQTIVFNVTSFEEVGNDDLVVRNLITSQTINLIIEKSADIEGDDELEPSQVEEIWAELNLKQNIHDEELETTAKDVVPAINELNDIKQNKQDNNLQTTSKNVVGAINEVDAHADVNTTNIATNTSAISGLDTRLTAVEQEVAGGESYIGTMTGATLPTNTQLDNFVQTTKGRAKKNGDLIYFVLEVTGGTDKIYHYKYSTTQGWKGVEMPAIESAGNGEKGIVQGTYNIGKTYETQFDIVGGEIKNIYVKDNASQYRNAREYINTTSTQVANIINGTTRVPNATNATNVTNLINGQSVNSIFESNGTTVRNATTATKATNDGENNNIVNTYMTKTEGATKSYVKNYALPREFNDLYYITSTGYSKDLPTGTTPIYSVEFGGVINPTIFTISKTDEAKYQLSNKNGANTNIYVSNRYNGSLKFILETKIRKPNETAITLSVEESNVIDMVAGEIYKLSFDDNFHNLTDDIEITDGATITQILKARVVSSIADPYIDVWSNEAYPSTFTLNITSFSIVVASGHLGELPVVALKDYTIDEDENNAVFEIPENLDGNTNIFFEVWIDRSEVSDLNWFYCADGEESYLFFGAPDNVTFQQYNGFMEVKTVGSTTYNVYKFVGFLNNEKTRVYVNIDAKDVKIIQSTANTTINNYSVPRLLRQDLTEIIDDFKIAKEVIVKNASGNESYKVLSAFLDGNNIMHISLLYQDIMIFTYSAENNWQADQVTITYKAIGSGEGAGNIFTIDSVIESSDWEVSTDLEGYNYSAGIEIEGAEITDVSIVSFSAEDADSGNFASICSTTTDLVTIYSKVAQDITIPVIATFKSSQDLTLKAPVISIADNTLTIVDSTTDVSYKIYAGDDLVDTTSNKTIDLITLITTEGVAQAITVISTKQGFIDSPASNAINYTKPSLVAPSISISDDTLTITDTNVFEVQFKIYADNDLVDTTSNTTIDLTQLFNDGETYAIKVCATNPNFNDSGFSLTISYQSKLNLILDNMVGYNNEQISTLVKAPKQETAFSNTQNEKLLFGTIFNNVANKIWFRWNEDQSTNPTLTLNFFLSNLGSATNVACKISLNNTTLFEGDLQVITGEAYQATKQFTFPTSTTEFSFFNELKIEFTDTTQQDAVLDYIDLTISNANNALILNRGNMFEMEGVKRSNGVKREFLTVYEGAGVFKYKGGGDDQNFVTLLETNNFQLSSVGGETFRFAQNSVRTYWDRISSKPKTNTTFHVTCYINQSNNLYVNYTQNETAINLTNNVIYAKKSHWNGSIGYTELIAGTTFNFHPFLVNWDTTYSYPVLGYQWTLKLNNEDIPDEFIDLIPVRDQYHSTRTTNTLGFGYFALHKSGYVLFFPDVSSTYFINIGKGRDVTAFASVDGLSVRVYCRFNNTIYCKTLTRTNIASTNWTLEATPETYNNYKEAVESDDIKYGLTNNYQIAFISQENN